MRDPFVTDVGAYVLGALEESERLAFEEHLRDCTECQEALDEVAHLPALLAVVPPEGATPPPTILAAVLERLRRESRRRWVGGLALAAALLVGVVVTAQLTAPRDEQPRPTSVALQPVADAPVSATVELTTVPWGTQIEVRCRYRGDRYTAPVTYALVVYDSGGHSEQVATWEAVPGRDLTVPAATAFPLHTITRVEMLSGDQVALFAEL